MYSIQAGFGQGVMPGTSLFQTAGAAAGTPVAAATPEDARNTAGFLQMSLNKPVTQGGVNAGISPKTYVFDAKTENALKEWLRRKGAPDQIAPGMWVNLVKGGLPEAGAKKWEAAIAYFKNWGVPAAAPKTITPKAMMRPTLFKTAVAKTPVTKPLGPAPTPDVVAACAGGTLKFIDGEWKCLRLGPPVFVPPPSAEPTALPEVPPAPEMPEQKVFVTYPAPDSGVVPEPEAMKIMMGPAVAPPPAKKKMPTWGWVALGLGGAAIVGGGIYFGIRHAKRAE